ncbi:MAG: PEF-CTERM sorting domain-containing protein [Methanolobus sp.]|nr:PEF-CTERM sorting domain-containing protein [Methanolobus sp.]
MKNTNLKKITLMLIAALMIIGTASAVAQATASAELIDEECDLAVWTYGNHNSITSGFESYFSSSVIGNTWTDADGRLAIIGENGYMTINTENPTDCFCIVFASDENDGYAEVYVDDEKVWGGDTWANVATEQPIDAQKIRSLKITGLQSTTHKIEIKNPNVNAVNDVHNGHVTVYKYGYNCPNTEIPEFPTIALPVAAILGLAFVFQRREE